MMGMNSTPCMTMMTSNTKNYTYSFRTKEKAIVWKTPITESTMNTFRYLRVFYT